MAMDLYNTVIFHRNYNSKKFKTNLRSRVQCVLHIYFVSNEIVTNVLSKRIFLELSNTLHGLTTRFNVSDVIKPVLTKSIVWFDLNLVSFLEQGGHTKSNGNVHDRCMLLL